MSRYGPTPASICDDIITALSVFKAAPASPTAKVKTLRRLAGELSQSDKGNAQLKRLLTEGTPAFLVAYLGGPFRPKGSAGRASTHERKFAVVCLNASFQDQDERFETAPDGTPGIEQLLDWATYYTFRALRDNTSLRNVKVLDHKPLRHEPEGYVYSAEFSCLVDVDFWDDTPAETLQRIGIVHSPTGGAGDLFEADNTTPKSNWPPTTDGGVTDL